MFAKRHAKGQFTEMDDVGRSLSADRRRTAKNATKPEFRAMASARVRRRVRRRSSYSRGLPRTP